MDANELIELLRTNPAVKREVLAIAQQVLPTGAIVGCDEDAAFKGFRAVTAPAHYRQKE